MVIAVVITVVVTTIIGGIVAGFDLAETTAQVIEVYRRMLTDAGRTGTQVPDVATLEPIVQAAVRMIPAVVPATWVMLVVTHLWIGAWVVRKSGRLARPPEDLAQIELPLAAGMVFAAALAVAFVPGPVGLLASVVGGALLSAHFLVGMGVLHALARASGMRIIILAFCYGLALLFTLPALLFVVAGLLEPLIGLRRRFPPRRSS